MCKLTSSLGVDIKLIDGVPNWSPRGADTFCPFKSGIDYVYLVKDGVLQTNTGIGVTASGMTQQNGYLKPSSSSVASGRINVSSIDMTKYKGVVADVETSVGDKTSMIWYVNNTNVSTGSRLSFANYQNYNSFIFACWDNRSNLINLYLIPNN